MRLATLLALGLILAGTWSQDSAQAQSAASPPVSLTPPNASPPQGNAKSAKPKREPTAVANDRRAPASSRREPSPPVIGGLPASPNSAADYDGFSARNDDSDTPSQVTAPARSRSARDGNGDAQSTIDQEDEALKRKLNICKNCK